MLKKAEGAACSSGVVQLQAESGQITTGGVTGSVRSVEVPGVGSCCAFSDLAALFVTRRYCQSQERELLSPSPSPTSFLSLEISSQPVLPPPGSCTVCSHLSCLVPLPRPSAGTWGRAWPCSEGQGGRSGHGGGQPGQGEGCGKPDTSSTGLAETGRANSVLQAWSLSALQRRALGAQAVAPASSRKQ